MAHRQVDDRANADLNAAGALRRTSRNVIQDIMKVGKGWTCIAKLHKPWLAHSARISASVANAPRDAATFEIAMADRSPGESTTAAANSFAPAS